MLEKVQKENITYLMEHYISLHVPLFDLKASHSIKVCGQTPSSYQWGCSLEG